MGNIPYMGSPDWRERFTTILKERNLNMKEVSLKAKKGETFVRDMLKRGRTPSFTNIAAACKAAGVDLSAILDEHEMRELAGPGARIDESPAPLNHAPLITPTDWPRDLPVFGAPIGGSGGIGFNGEVLGYMRRPPKLQGVKSAYAVYMHGSSMAPWRKNGEAVYVHPGMPCDAGDYVVVQLRPENGGEPPRALIKELVRRTDKELRLKQFNPPKEITVPAAKVLALHRVVDWTELLGG